MKQFVTGGAGFIGSHLCERLVARGYTVVAEYADRNGRADCVVRLSAATTTPSWLRFSNEPKNQA